ncbi:MAG: hypothetical protein HY731_11040, partial [Candidatus Tectomicrobia bacterium]|nr:hypothetical protein [Candidatus Tectomicrobia bacterium]
MSKLRAVVFLVFTSFLVTSGTVSAYDLATHGQLTQRAFEGSSGVHNYLDVLSIKESDVFDPTSATPFGKLGEFFQNTGTVMHWMMEGSVREDDFGTAIPTCPQPKNPPTSIDRPRNHFFDVQRGGGGLSTWFANGYPAPGWALGQQGRSENQFTILDARIYQFKSLTESTKEAREQNTALLFRTLGQVIHLVQDMAQPQHTRNDPHAGCLFGIGGEHSWYEDYIDKRARGARFRTRGQPAPPLSFGGYLPPRFANYNDFWTTIDQKSLADFSSRNFLSARTNFSFLSPLGGCGGLSEPTCDPFNPKAYTQRATPFSFQTVDGKTISGEVTLFLGNVHDRLTGTTIPNVAVSSRSLWDQHLESQGFFPVFSLNTLNYDSMSDLLLPRAVGYATGLLDYFFRGKINLVPNEGAGSGYVIENNTDEDMQGSFELYYDNTSNERVKITDGDFPLVTLIPRNSRSGTVNFTSPTDAKEPGTYLVVFRGELGNETDAVVGRVIKSKTSGIYLLALDFTGAGIFYWDIETDERVKIQNPQNVHTYLSTLDNWFYVDGEWYNPINSVEEDEKPCEFKPGNVSWRIKVTNTWLSPVWTGADQSRAGKIYCRLGNLQVGTWTEAIVGTWTMGDPRCAGDCSGSYHVYRDESPFWRSAWTYIFSPDGNQTGAAVGITGTQHDESDENVVSMEENYECSYLQANVNSYSKIYFIE